MPNTTLAIKQVPFCFCLRIGGRWIRLMGVAASLKAVPAINIVAYLHLQTMLMGNKGVNTVNVWPGLNPRSGCHRETDPRNPPRSKLRPSRNGRVSGKAVAKFDFLEKGFWKSLSISSVSTLSSSRPPSRFGRVATCCGVGSKSLLSLAFGGGQDGFLHKV